MVSYTRWVGIVFEVWGDQYPATQLMEVAGAQWTQKKQALKDATVSEAREYAKTL